MAGSCFPAQQRQHKQMDELVVNDQGPEKHVTCTVLLLQGSLEGSVVCSYMCPPQLSCYSTRPCEPSMRILI